MGNTPNLGLTFPANTDPLANMAAAIQSLANSIESALGTTPATYAPTLTAVTTNPTLGTGGTISGWKTQRGKSSVEFVIDLLLGGAGLSGGAGQWKVSLPVAAHATKNGFRRDYPFDLFDSSANVSYHCVAMLVPSVDPNALFLNYISAASDALVALTGAANPPGGLAVGDRFTFHGLYVPA